MAGDAGGDPLPARPDRSPRRPGRGEVRVADPRLEVNRRGWDERVPTHIASDFYDVEGFRRGEMRIQRAEVELVGDVNGKSLLHLQCHFGLDTLSWARLGARVTGVDFSAPAIEQAEALAAELAIPSRFVCSDVYTLPEHLEGEFDIVYTSWGVLCWLPDLAGWSSVVARFLKPGGRFHLFEFHPVADVFDDQLRPAYRYFFEDEGYREHWDATYADLDADVHGESWEWSHPVSEIVGSLLAAGLRLERLDEFPWIPWPRFRGLVPGRLPRTWELPTGHLPLSLHIEASR